MGHAIERSRGILHGEAVSVGMIMAARLSALHGLLTASEVDRVEKLLVSAGLPIRLELDPEELYQNVRKDKKKSGDEVHLVLLKGLGNTLIKPIAFKDLKSIIHDLC